jgi:hypothetical protein
MRRRRPGARSPMLQLLLDLRNAVRQELPDRRFRLRPRQTPNELPKRF